MNRYPLWKNLLIIFVLAIGVFYALPNIYGRSPVVQISSIKDAAVDENLVTTVKQKLTDAGINNVEVSLDKETLIARFENLDDQFKGKEILNNLEDYKSALNLKPNVPEWLDNAGGKAMNLGLDLRGGVHFLMQVDMKEALESKSSQLRSDVTQILSKAKISKRSIKWQGDTLVIKFKNDELASQAYDKLRREVTDLNINQRSIDGVPAVSGTIRELAIQEIKIKALEQNISTIR